MEIWAWIADKLPTIEVLVFNWVGYFNDLASWDLMYRFMLIELMSTRFFAYLNLVVSKSVILIT